MDIDKIINGVADEVKTHKIEQSKASDQTFWELKTKPNKTEEDKNEIFYHLKEEIDLFIDSCLEKSADVNKDKGLQKCCLETWQAICFEIGMFYFNRNKYLRKDMKEGRERGQYFDDEMLEIALNLYEYYCNIYRKQFFIYDFAKFCGMNMDTMYLLNEKRSDILKKGHTMQEGSMRTALASGRSNVTAMAILLNHDYDYTRTTQVIHTTEGKKITADMLPRLEQTQDIVYEGNNEQMPETEETL